MVKSCLEQLCERKFECERKDWVEEKKAIWLASFGMLGSVRPAKACLVHLCNAPPSASSDRLDLALLEKSELVISNLAIPS